MSYEPTEANLGKECEFWGDSEHSGRCQFSLPELCGRISCNGIVDEVCLYIKDGRVPRIQDLTRSQKAEMAIRHPSLNGNFSIQIGLKRTE